MQLHRSIDTDCVHGFVYSGGRFIQFMWFSVFCALCIQCVAAQPKKGSETVTFSPLVNTAAISETSSDSKPTRQIDRYITLQ